jgi:hypothetical protein
MLHLYEHHAPIRRIRPTTRACTGAAVEGNGDRAPAAAGAAYRTLGVFSLTEASASAQRVWAAACVES